MGKGHRTVRAGNVEVGVERGLELEGLVGPARVLHKQLRVQGPLGDRHLSRKGQPVVRLGPRARARPSDVVYPPGLRYGARDTPGARDRARGSAKSWGSGTGALDPLLGPP